MLVIFVKELLMKKKIISAFMIALLGFSATACSFSTTDNTDSGEADSAQEISDHAETAVSETGSSGTTESSAAATTGAAETAAEEEEYDPGNSVLTGEPIDPVLAEQRPIAVMYPIDRAAQPQYGLSNVDVFYEILEEGGMSRQMGIIQDWQNLDRIGNIRSTRAYFVQEALEWDPIIVHYGGPINYTKEILTREDVDNINGTGGVLGSDYGAFYRIPAGSISEHTAYTDSDHLNSAIDLAGFSRTHREEYYNKKHFTFAKDDSLNTLEQYSDSVTATELSMAGAYPVTESGLTYNPDDQLYYKTLYHEPQCDGETGEQMTFTNVLIQRAVTRSRVPGSLYLRVLIEDDDEDGFFLTNGRMIHVTWQKQLGHSYQPTTFYDDDGNEITLNPGKTMIFIITEKASFNVDGTDYTSDIHKTLTADDLASDATTGSTSETAAEIEPADTE